MVRAVQIMENGVIFFSFFMNEGIVVSVLSKPALSSGSIQDGVCLSFILVLFKLKGLFIV